MCLHELCAPLVAQGGTFGARARIWARRSGSGAMRRRRRVERASVATARTAEAGSISVNYSLGRGCRAAGEDETSTRGNPYNPYLQAQCLSERNEEYHEGTFAFDADFGVHAIRCSCGGDNVRLATEGIPTVIRSTTGGWSLSTKLTQRSLQWVTRPVFPESPGWLSI